MEIVIQKQIEIRKAYLQEVIKNKEIALKAAPQGNLRIQKRKYKNQYYWIKEEGDTKGSFIRRENTATAYALAQKEYDERIIRLAKKELAKIDEYSAILNKGMIDDLYSSYNEMRKELINPIIPTDEQLISSFLNKKFVPKGFEEGDGCFYTTKGLRVRSKSEALIANALDYYEVPYHYEYPLELKGLGLVHPDFLCLNVVKRKEIFWEHFGMMDSFTYSNRNIKKITYYEQNGYLVGDKLLATFESSQAPIDSNIIKCKIEKYLLA